jgi:hypothetical protein
MNKYILCLIVMALPACSSMTSETYTEKRTLKYPKGTHPHIKDMYLHDKNDPQPAQYTPASEDWKYTTPEIPASYEQIQDQNRMILAQYYNNWLRE